MVRVSGNNGGGCRLSGRANVLGLSHILFASARCPTGCNFVPEAFTSSNSPLSILILYDRAVRPVALIRYGPVNILGVISGSDYSRGVVTIPIGSPGCGYCDSVDRLPGRCFRRVRRFFRICGALRTSGIASMARASNISGTGRVVRGTVADCVHSFRVTWVCGSYGAGDFAGGQWDFFF